MTHVLTHNFRGRDFVVKWVHMPSHYGKCLTPPHAPVPTLKFRKKMDGLTQLDTLIHESMHACFEDFDESVILQCSTDIAKFLWNIGYRIHD